MILGLLLSIFLRDIIKMDKSQLLTIAIIATLPLLVDSVTQATGFRESNNILRFITGGIAGFICGFDIYFLLMNNYQIL